MDAKRRTDAPPGEKTPQKMWDLLKWIFRAFQWNNNGRDMSYYQVEYGSMAGGID